MGNYTCEHLNSINLKYYSQTCSNGHLCNTTNVKSAQANSRPVITVQDNHLSNATSDHFFKPKWKKACPKQLQNFIHWRNAKKNKEQCIKDKRLSDYYCNANL